jgi:hypothetical protein
MFGKRKASGGDERSGSESHQPPIAEHLRPYTEAVEQLGATFEATLWASKSHQRTRFEVLMGMCPFEGLSVLDAGCARGDLGVFLVEHSSGVGKYIGVEGVPELVQAAKEHAPAGSFVGLGDFVSDPGSMSRVAREAGEQDGRADVLVFSGSLNTLRTDAALEVLARAWPMSRKALAFNFLSDRCAPELRARETGPAHRFDTRRVLDWAMSNTPAVLFRQDYFAGGHDATVVMLREGA